MAVLCTRISSVNGRFALNCHMGGDQKVTQSCRNSAKIRPDTPTNKRILI